MRNSAAGVRSIISRSIMGDTNSFQVLLPEQNADNFCSSQERKVEVK
jgi:hypothetical protein